MEDVIATYSSRGSERSLLRVCVARLRRRLQFSLRGILLLTAAAAVLTMPLFRLRQQQLAVKQLEEYGCGFTSEATRGPFGWAAGRLFGDGAALHVTQVVWKRDDRGRTVPQRPDLAPLGPLQWVNRIDMSWMPVDDEGASHLRGLQQLTTLKLNGAAITDRGLEYLIDCKSLKRLELHRAPITDAGLEYLTDLTTLENLDLSGTKITGKDLEPLARLPALEILNLNGTPLTDDAVGVLSRLQRLLWLGVSDTRLSEAAREKLVLALPTTAIDD